MEKLVTKARPTVTYFLTVLLKWNMVFSLEVLSIDRPLTLPQAGSLPWRIVSASLEERWMVATRWIQVPDGYYGGRSRLDVTKRKDSQVKQKNAAIAKNAACHIQTKDVAV